MANPLADYNDLLRSIGIQMPRTFGQPPSTEPQLPELTPEEQDSLLSQITGGILGGVQYVGETLDKPGAALRGLLAGKPAELLNLIPFSDALGITDPNTRVSGRDLLEGAGILDPNTPGLDAGDVAGFGAEVLLDPLNAVSFGGKGVLTAAGKAIRAADMASGAVPRLLEHAASPAARIAEVSGKAGALGDAAGAALRDANTPLRGVVGFGLENSPLGWLGKKAGLFTEETPFLGSNIVPKWATGEGPAKVLDALYYGKYTGAPVRSLRSLLDTRVMEQRLGDAQRLADLISAEKLYYKADFAQTGKTLTDKFRASQVTFDELFKSSDDPMLFENMMRNFVEMKGGTTPETVFDALNTMNASASVDDLQAAATKFHELAEHMRQIDADTHETLLRYGLNINKLADNYIEHFPRRITQEAEKELEYAGKKMVSTAFPFKEARDLIYKNFPGGTPAVNQATSIGWGVGREWNPEGADATFEALADTIPMARRVSRAYPESAWQAELYKTADELGIPREQAKAVAEDAFQLAKEQYQPVRATWDNAVDELKNRGLTMGKIQAVLRKGGDYTDPSMRFFDEVADYLKIGGDPNNYSQALWDMLAQGAPRAPLKRHAETLNQVRAMLEGQAYTRSFFKDAGEETVQWGSKPYNLDTLEGIASQMMDDTEYAPIFWGMDENAFQTPGRMLFDFLKDGGEIAIPDYADNLAAGAAGSDVAKYSKKAFKNYLVQKFNLPAWWRTGELLQEQLARTPGYEWAIDLAGPDKFPQFAEKFKADWLTKNAASVPDPTILAKLEAMRPDRFVDRFAKDILEVDVLAPSDLDKLVDKLEKMPVEILQNDSALKYPPVATKEEAQKLLRGLKQQNPNAEYAIIKQGDKWLVTRPAGLFNRSTLVDQLDYLEHAAKVQWALSSVHRMFADNDIATLVKPDQNPAYSLAQAWQDMGLEDLGLLTLMQKRGAQFATDPDSVAKLGDSLTQAKRMAEKIDVPQEVVTAATRFMKAHTQPESVSGLLGVIDRFLSMFKGGVTIPFPAFHVRNIISGQYANWQAGQFTPKSVTKAWSLARGKPIQVGELSGEAILQELADHGVLEGTGLHVISSVGDTAAKPVSLIDALKESVKSDAGEITWRSVASAANPMNMRGAPSFSALLGKGKTLDERITGFVTPKEASKFAPLKAGEAAYKQVEFLNRAAPYIALREAGYSAAEAAQKVKLSQFDYSELTHFERGTMKRLIPFYSFSRKNLPFQLKMLVDNPGGRTAQTIRAYNVARDESKSKGYVPRYLSESLSVNIGGDAENQKFLSISGLLPFEEALNRFAFSGGVPDVTRTLQKFAGQLNPAVQWPIEAMTGVQLWSGRNRANLYQTPTPFPAINHMLYSGAVPYTARATSTVRPFFDDRKSMGQALFNAAIGGVKVTDVSPEAKLLEGRDILQRQLPSERGAGVFTRVFARDIEKMSPATQARMALYNSLAAELSRRRKAKEKAKK